MGTARYHATHSIVGHLRDDVLEDARRRETVRAKGGEIDDGPMPRWAGLVWVPLLLFGIAVLVGLVYLITWVSF